jgi:hypothetical protein
MIQAYMQRTAPSSTRSAPGWVHLAAALAAGLGLRLLAVHFYGQTSGDTLVYGDIAKNLLLHGVYGMSSDNNPVPTLIRLPGYPLFLGACFRIFGMEHYTAVMLVQSVADLGTCALCGAIAARLFGWRAGTCTLWLGVLCPFTADYVSAPLTETLSLFCIALAFYALTRWSMTTHEGPLKLDRNFWMMAVALSYAILLRPDGGLLAAAVVPAMAWIAWTHRDATETKVATHAHAVGLTIVLSVAVLLPLGPWAYRNWRDFHIIEPLAPRYATDPAALVGYGFNHWYRSWAVEFTSTEDVYWNLNADPPIAIDDIPTRAFDTDAQYNETAALLADYNKTSTLTQSLDDRFQKIADERIAANPMRYYVTMPAARLLDMWLRPRTEMLPVSSAWWKYREHPGQSIFSWAYAALNLAYILATGFGAWAACRWLPREKRPLVYAMLAYVALRSALLFTLDNSEDRYTLEFFPIFFVLAGACICRSWKKKASIV